MLLRSLVREALGKTADRLDALLHLGSRRCVGRMDANGRRRNEPFGRDRLLDPQDNLIPGQFSLALPESKIVIERKLPDIPSLEEFDRLCGRAHPRPCLGIRVRRAAIIKPQSHT